MQSTQCYSIENVKNAINRLQNPTQTSEANKFLIEFQKSNASFHVLTQLIIEPKGSPYRLYAAIQLYNKIQRDFDTISQEQIQPFFTELLSRAISFSQESPLDTQSCRYVCLSIATVAIQLNIHGIVSQILRWFNEIISNCPEILLELLTALPEESYNQNNDVTEDLRAAFCQELSQSLPEVLNFLHFLLSQSPLETKIRILRCFEKWIDFTDSPSSTIVTHKVFFDSLEYLKWPDSLDVSAEIIMTYFKKYGCGENYSVSKYLITKVIELANTWNSLIDQISKSSDDFDTQCVDDDLLQPCRIICRLVTETCEACMSLLLKEDVIINQEFDSLIRFLIQCISFPYDFSIARIPLKFIYDLSTIIKTHKSPLSVQLNNLFMTIFTEVLGFSVNHLVLPERILSGSKVFDDLLADKRCELHDTVSDCSTAIGVLPCLSYLCRFLQTEASNSLARVEAALFALQAIIGDVSLNSEEELLLNGQIIAFTASLPNDKIILNLTIIHLIGKSSIWFSKNDSYLPNELSKLCQSLSDPKLALQASKSIMYLCRNCSKSTYLPIHQLIIGLQQVHDSKILSNEAESFYIEALCYGVTSVPQPTQGTYLSQIFTPLKLSLEKNNLKKDSANVIGDIDALTSIFRFYGGGDTKVLTVQFIEIQQLLQVSLHTLPDNERVCEKVCRLYKYVMKATTADTFGSLVPAMALFLAECFHRTPFSAFIYASAILLSCYYREGNGAYITSIHDLFTSISSHFFSIMNTFTAFENKPDLVEEYFYFIGRCLEYFPDPIISSPISSALIQSAMIGLQLRHRDAQKGILLFFEKLLDACLSSRSLEKDLLISQCGPSVTDALIKSLAGLLPSYALDENNGCIGDVMWNMYSFNPTLFQDWVTQSFRDLPNRYQQIAIKSKLLNISDSIQTKREFIRLLADFEWRCKDK